MKTEDLYKTKNEKPSKSGPIATLLSIILIPILIVVMISSCIKSKKPDGTWKLVEITGTADVRANYEQNYIELKDGTWTVYLELISPRKSDIKTYKYKGKKFENIEFEDSMIYAEGQRIVLHLQFEDNTYAFLRYERK